MEHFNLQLVLLVVGIVVILFVLWDSKRRRVTQRDSQENVSAEEVEEFYQQRDGSGYDVLGVGLSRIVTTEDELVANRSDDIALEQESLVASRDDDLQSVDSDIDKTERQPKQSSSRVLQQPDLIVSITLLSKQESFNGE